MYELHDAFFLFLREHFPPKSSLRQTCSRKHGLSRLGKVSVEYLEKTVLGFSRHERVAWEVKKNLFMLQCGY